MKNKFDTFIFDLDGTLLDTLPDLVVLTNEALEASGFPLRTETEILSYVGNGVKALIYQAVPEDASPAEAETVMTRWKSLYPELGSTLTKEYEGMTEMLLSLKSHGKKIGVLSNKFDAGVKQLIGDLFPDLFEVAYGECTVIPRKPDPTGLRYVIEELQSLPDESVYIGDSPGDVRTARAAGVYSIGVAWGYHTPESIGAAQPDAIVNRPLEILSFI